MKRNPCIHRAILELRREGKRTVPLSYEVDVAAAELTFQFHRVICTATLQETFLSVLPHELVRGSQMDSEVNPAVYSVRCCKVCSSQAHNSTPVGGADDSVASGATAGQTRIDRFIGQPIGEDLSSEQQSKLMEAAGDIESCWMEAQRFVTGSDGLETETACSEPASPVAAPLIRNGNGNVEDRLDGVSSWDRTRRVLRLCVAVGVADPESLFPFRRKQSAVSSDEHASTQAERDAHITKVELEKYRTLLLDAASSKQALAASKASQSQAVVSAMFGDIRTRFVEGRVSQAEQRDNTGCTAGAASQGSAGVPMLLRSATAPLGFQSTLPVDQAAERPKPAAADAWLSCSSGIPRETEHPLQPSAGRKGVREDGTGWLPRPAYARSSASLGARLKSSPSLQHSLQFSLLVPQAAKSLGNMQTTAPVSIDRPANARRTLSADPLSIEQDELAEMRMDRLMYRRSTCSVGSGEIPFHEANGTAEVTTTTIDALRFEAVPSSTTGQVCLIDEDDSHGREPCSPIDIVEVTLPSIRSRPDADSCCSENKDDILVLSSKRLRANPEPLKFRDVPVVVRRSTSCPLGGSLRDDIIGRMSCFSSRSVKPILVTAVVSQTNEEGGGSSLEVIDAL